MGLPAIRKAVKWSWGNGNVFENRKRRGSVKTNIYAVKGIQANE